MDVNGDAFSDGHAQHACIESLCRQRLLIQVKRDSAVLTPDPPWRTPHP
jgi:hypothetical protein